MWNTALIDGPIPTFSGNGYSLNIAAQLLTLALAPYVIEPAHPKRVFAGDDPSDRELTICLQFSDEAEARTALPAYWQTEVTLG